MAAAAATAIALLIALIACLIGPAVTQTDYRDPRAYKLVFTTNKQAYLTNLGCWALNSNQWAYLIQINLKPGDGPAVMPFNPGTGPFRIQCKWAYNGNYAKEVVLFDTAWPNAQACRWRNGGCGVLFEDEEVFLITQDGKGRRTLLGDLPIKRCQKNFFGISTKCWYPPHQHQYVGRIIGYWEYLFGKAF